MEGSPEEILAAATQSLGQSSSDLEKWVAETLINESRRLIRRRLAAEAEIAALKQETLIDQIINLKRTPDIEYGDIFNRLVSTLLDNLLQIGTPIPVGQNQLAFAESLVRDSLLKKITTTDIQNFIASKGIEKTKNRLKKKLEKIMSRGEVTSEAALKFCALIYELDCLKTDDVWNIGKYEGLLLRGVEGQKINLATVLCTINQFDYQGNYTLVPDLDAYQTNPRLEAIPLILNELFSIQKLLIFYGVANELTILVADTDYTEIGQYGPVSETNLTNLETYLVNLEAFAANFSNGLATIKAISDVTDNDPEYMRVKNDVLGKVSSFKDLDFSQKWYPRFEQAVEKVSESQTKKRLFPEKEIRRQSLDITRKIWAVNAGQGAVLSSLGENTLFLSTERRERDTNYVIDSETVKKFPPVIYVLRAAESWNRKLVSDPA